MPRRGENIYRRKDGLWEARYTKGFDIDGKRRYGSVYAHSYREVKEKRQEIVAKLQLFPKYTSIGDSNIHRVDVYNPHDYEPRLPTCDLSGANDKFIEGGRTPGGQDECVINRFPNPESNPSVGKVSTIEPGNNFSQASNNPQMNFSNTDGITGGSQAPPERTLGGNGSVNPSDCDIPIPKTNAANPDAASSVDPVSSSVNKGINF